MNIFKGVGFLAIFAMFFVSCQQEPENFIPGNLDVRLEQMLKLASNGQGKSYYILPESNDYHQIPQSVNNPMSDDKVQLGRLLFHETALSQDSRSELGVGTYSCSSCHHAPGGFQACLPQGIADGGVGFGKTGEARKLNPAYDIEDVDVQPIRTPSALNSAYQKNIMWNGQFGANGKNIGTENVWEEGTPLATNKLGYDGAETQAIAALEVHRMDIQKSIDMLSNPENGYKSLFNKVFNHLPEEERISNETAGLAIGAYERTLLANEAPFQKWLRGEEDAMTDEQKMGAVLFFDKAQCASCHNGPALNSMEFYALGMKDLYDGAAGEVLTTQDDTDANLGRGGFTKLSQDNYKFKVPQLYNLKSSPFYGHGSSFRSVRELVHYKNEAVAENSNVPEHQLADEFKPLRLTDEEIEYISDFVENALYDAELSRYEPDHLPSGNCFPNNDIQSKLDRGCD